MMRNDTRFKVDILVSRASTMIFDSRNKEKRMKGRAEASERQKSHRSPRKSAIRVAEANHGG